MPTARPGVYPLRSAFGLRKWLADRLMVLQPDARPNALYSTLYMLPLLRLLGARVGPRAEVSTVSHIDPDLLTLGAESFVADLAVVGAARYHNGSSSLGATEAGRAQLRRQRGAGAWRHAAGARQPDRRAVGAAAAPGGGGHVVARFAGDLPAAPAGQREVRRSRDVPPAAAAGRLPAGDRVLARRAARRR